MMIFSKEELPKGNDKLQVMAARRHYITQLVFYLDAFGSLHLC